MSIQHVVDVFTPSLRCFVCTISPGDSHSAALCVPLLQFVDRLGLIDPPRFIYTTTLPLSAVMVCLQPQLHSVSAVSALPPLPLAPVPSFSTDPSFHVLRRVSRAPPSITLPHRLYPAEVSPGVAALAAAVPRSPPAPQRSLIFLARAAFPILCFRRLSRYSTTVLF